MKHLFNQFYIITFLGIILTSCGLTGEEIARIEVLEVSKEGNLKIAETTIDLKANDKITVWSDMDLEFEDNLALEFQIKILKNGEEHREIKIDPFDKDITLSEFKTNIGNNVSWSFTGRNAGYTIEEDATYTFKAILFATKNPSLKLKKADIVIKK